VQMILRVRRGLLGDELLQMISRVRKCSDGENPCVDHLRVRHCWLGGSKPVVAGREVQSTFDKREGNKHA
jgi:hypothetical protein